MSLGKLRQSRGGILTSWGYPHTPNLTFRSGYRVERARDQGVVTSARTLLGVWTDEDRDVGAAFRIGIFNAPLTVPLSDT